MAEADPSRRGTAQPILAGDPAHPTAAGHVPARDPAAMPDRVQAVVALADQVGAVGLLDPLRYLSGLRNAARIIAARRDQNRGGPSFPSGHTTDNTVIALCCTLFYRRRGWLYWIVAAAVGYSRVYLGAHWPSDGIATVFLAGGETLIIIAALESLWRLIGPRQFPNVFQKHPSLVFDDRRNSRSRKS